MSVCIITYRHERYIEQAVRAVLVQETSFPVEIVIGEDASPDDTRGVLQRLDREFPGRLTLLLRESNLGMHRNFSHTYSRCKGEFVALLEGDDYWTDPHKLQRQVDALDRHPDWSGCFHQVECVNAAGRPLGTRRPVAYRGPVSFDDLCHSNWVPTCSLLIRKAAVPRIPDWFYQMAMADWPLCLLAAITGRLGMLPDTMACYRVHPGGQWTSQAHNSQVTGRLRAFTTAAEHLPPEYTLRLLKGQQHYAEQVLNARAATVSYRLGRALLSPLIWLYETFHRCPVMPASQHPPTGTQNSAEPLVESDP